MIGPLLLQIVLISLNAAFASAEIAVISMNENKLKKLAADGDGRALKLTALTEQPARFLATIQVAITLAGLLGSAFAAENFATPLVAAMVSAGITIPENLLKTVSVLFITLVLSYFSLVFGELVPKRIAMKKSESLALGMSGVLYGVSKLFAPLVFLLTASTNGILRLLGINPEEDGEKVSEEEIRMLLMAGNEQGTIKPAESEMIQNVFEFDDLSVAQLCTHRIDITSLALNSSLEEWEDVIRGSRHTYYPIWGENQDDIIGILDTKDYFRIGTRDKDMILEQAVDKAYFIPESMKANILFQNMRQSRCYFAVIIDEYGGLCGIITLHDLMEALVGDINETNEPEAPAEIEKTGESAWCIQGCTDLEEVAKELKLDLPVDSYDTFSGFLCGVLGRIPNEGESFSCTPHGLLIQIHTVSNHKIDSASVRIESVHIEEE